jgi:hypothetical protein
LRSNQRRLKHEPVKLSKEQRALIKTSITKHAKFAVGVYTKLMSGLTIYIQWSAPRVAPVES